MRHEQDRADYIPAYYRGDLSRLRSDPGRFARRLVFWPVVLLVASILALMAGAPSSGYIGLAATLAWTVQAVAYAPRAQREARRRAPTQSRG